MRRKRLLIIIRILISLILIGYILISLAVKQGGMTAGFEKFIEAIASASILWLLPALILHLVGFSLNSLRWKILLKPQGVEAAFSRLFLYYFMASFFNLFLPSTIGGDTVRAIESRKLTGTATTSVMVVIIERLTGVMALVLITAVALGIRILQNASQEKVIWIFLIIAVGGFFVLIGIAHPRVASMILRLFRNILPKKIYSLGEQAYDAVAIYYRRPLALLASLGVSTIFHLNMVLYYFFIAKALHQNPDAIEFMMKIPIMMFLMMTIPAINGLGVITAGFKELMRFPEAFALSTDVINQGMRIGYGLIGGLIFVFYRRTREKKGTHDIIDKPKIGGEETCDQ